MEYKLEVLFHNSAWEGSVFPAAFVKWVIHSQWGNINSFAKDQSAVGTWISFFGEAVCF